MYLKKLQLYGFKSFANKTEFVFEPGVTAIVGPNGCGKSNISDAIKWVLGEQSAKSLRGLQMQDVIFNGTTQKEPVNFAEVSLVLSNHSKILPIDYEEVTISRRLFRSGESEYLLNKTAVRLKDIAELLMGTGIGVDNYFIMEQGKIDLILSSKPEERRAIFEEASGITKFKSKKREALNKLEATEANLLRLNDIIAEVQRQINSIERQAAKARRYKKHFQRLKELELSVSHIEYEDLKKQRQRLQADIDKAESSRGDLSRDIELLSGEIKSVREELEAADSEASNIKEDYSRAENSIFRAKEKAQLDNERIKELNALIDDLSQHLGSSAVKIEELKAQAETLRSERDLFSSQRQAKEDSVNQKKDLLSVLEKDIEAARLKISDSKTAVLEKTNQNARAKNETAKIAANSQGALNRVRRLEIEKQNCLSALTASKDKLSVAENELNSQSQKVSDMELKAHALEAELKNIQQRLQSLDKERDLTQKELAVAQSRLVLLQDIAQKRASFKDRVKEFLSDPDIKNKPWYGDIYAVMSDLNTCIENEGGVSLLSERLQLLADEKEKIQRVIVDLTSELAILNEQALKEQIELANKQTGKTHNEQEFTKLKEELSVIELELDDISEELGNLRQEDEALNSQIVAFEKELGELTETINNNQNWMQANLKEKELVLVDLAKTSAELDSFNQRYLDLENNLNVLTESMQRENTLYQSRLKQIDDSKTRIISLSLEIEQLAGELKALEVQKSETENNLKIIAGKRIEITSKVSDKQACYEKLHKDLQDLNSAAHSYQMQATQIDFQKQRLEDRMSQTYKIDLGSYKLLIQHDADVQQEPLVEFNIESARSEIEELKAKLDSIGSVNLDAVSEETELNDRFNNMVTQREDLLKAKENLLDAISKINKTTKDMFVNTFNKIQEEFKNFFKLLFGGGDTELFLVDESDVLESGIEIVAKPPGKRLQNISLLSGGEKTMTALALLFAVFKIKPSPFCVMDEMDAPLDEANIDRFSRVLAEFTKNSQFIIITHNKKTIAISNVMYGITMEESGISKVVSVKFFDKNEQPVNQEAVAA